MKIKRGFTLVELLGVFTLLGVIAILITPYVTGLLQKSKDNEYSDFKNTIFLATESYINTKGTLLNSTKSKNHKECIGINELIEAGFLENDLFDPKEKKMLDEIKDEWSVTIDLRTNKYDYIKKSYYITDDLKIWYDGYRSGNDQSIWKDLSGNDNNGILANFNFTDTSGPTNNGNIIFDGIDDFIQTSFEVETRNTTIEIVTKMKSYDANTKNTLIKNDMFDTSYEYSGALWYPWNLNFSFKDKSSYLQKEEEYTINSIAGTYNTSNKRLCIYNPKNNAISRRCEDYVTFNNDGDLKYIIGQKDSQFSNMEVYAVRIYNKVLTEEEIKSNYEIDKIRFNI